jgi:CRP-like cAMP-binding protein
MPRSTTPARANRILASLSRDDFALLKPHLHPADLPVRLRLEAGNRPIDHVYFIESGIASVVANGINHRTIEAGLIGWEGMTGLAVVMATDRTPHETFMQIAGSGMRIASGALRRAMELSATLRVAFLNFAHAFFVQTTHTAMTNGSNKIEERLARWLLMAHDRIDGDQLPLTHDFLAIMLGVRRPGVTVALNQFERNGLILASRGVISIVDRNGLTHSANGSYGTPEAEFDRLFGLA